MQLFTSNVSVGVRECRRIIAASFDTEFNKLLPFTTHDSERMKVDDFMKRDFTRQMIYGRFC